MSEQSPYLLTFDLGPSSIGWAVMGLQENGGCTLKNVEALGVRIFEQGVEGDIASGRDSSRNEQRRMARMRRRQLDRRRDRMAALLSLLQHHGLLPSGNMRSARARVGFFQQLDAELLMKQIAEGRAPDQQDKHFRQVFIYTLRAQALDRKLEPFELGRILYHLFKRRGFLSNRKSALRKDEDLGQIKGAIKQLTDRIGIAGCRTLGEYLARIDPEEERIRRRWLGREMVEDEFLRIWEVQARYHPAILTEGLFQAIRKAALWQLPLRNQKNLIGFCELEPDCRRAPWASLEAQRFRCLQKVNDLTVIPKGETARSLSPEERAKLLLALDVQGDMKFSTVRKLLGLPRDSVFNLEAGGEKNLPGNRIVSKLTRVFGERLASFSEADLLRVIEDLRSIEKESALEKRGRTAWGLDQEQADAFSRLSLEPRYCSLSRKAIRRLLPEMEAGVPFATAKKNAYPERSAALRFSLLPPLGEVLPELRNPAVHRVLSELRKVVNALIRRHGRPEYIRVELARDLRRSRFERERMSRVNRIREKERDHARHRIKKEARVQNPSRADIDKVLLAEECAWTCPYTGRHFGMHDLISPSPNMDIEHILPLSRSLDDSFGNKTLCDVQENRNRKGKQTPWEAYGGEPERYAEILARVGRFAGDPKAVSAKLRRFKATDEDLGTLEQAAGRLLTDTRYATRLAARYLGGLYGDDEGVRVQTCSGQITAIIRSSLGLNAVLGADVKNREDHRHHAVDAVAMSLASPAIVKALSDAARDRELHGKRGYGRISEPWAGFIDAVCEKIDPVLASPRVNRKARGQLHEETLYGRVQVEGEDCFVVRKPLQTLSAKQTANSLSIYDIIDPRLRQVVVDAWEASGRQDPKKLFAVENNLPVLTGGNGRRMRVKCVRVRKAISPEPLGEPVRFVNLGSNHHIEVFEISKGKKRQWTGRLVTLHEAARRANNGTAMVDRTSPEDFGKFLFSLTQGEVIRVPAEDGLEAFFRVRTVYMRSSRGLYIDCSPLNDARLKAEIRKGRQWIEFSLNKLREMGATKVSLTPLGEVRAAHD
ncbi:type II CRISPR RNA-guided endonuclease Cas9 [Desulfovibrio aminophilus]|uniref:type II CRISPR RNA-guided endonuclease Cas9 n=1 Tax=Desulfovibrio aminophilus TaxID=81425 RepID=UPI003390799D